MATAATASDDLQPVKRNRSYELLPPSMSELRVVLLGNSWSERSSVGNLILEETKFNTEEKPDGCLRVRGQLKEKEIVLINTPDLLLPDISANKLRMHVEECVRLCDPGPHVFLLVLQPEDFTEEHKVKLCRVLRLFSDQALEQSLILISTPREENPAFMDKLDQPLKDMMRLCRYRYLKQKNLEPPELLTRLGQTVKENSGDHVSCDVFEDENGGLIMTPKSAHMKPSLKLVLCGRRGAGKTSAAKVILGQTELHPVSSSSECVKHQGEVCGRQVSLVELPVLYGKPEEEVMEESFRCISLCGPEGVHAFILVLPVGPLTDEDKGELETIQNTFSSPVKDFTMILFTVESDPKAPDVVEFINKTNGIQELCQSCGGRYVVLNIKDQQQIPELLDAVIRMRGEGSKCFTMKMFTTAQMEKVSKLRAELLDVKQKSVMAGANHDAVLQRKQEDLKTINIKIKEQNRVIENERKLRAKRLQDKDECIKKEREERKKEREERKRKKQEETLRQEWKKKLEASVQSQREQKENAIKNLEQLKKERKRDQAAWDKERKDTWEQIRQEDKQSLEEWKTNYRKLQEEYHSKRGKWTYVVGLLLFLLFLLCFIFLSGASTHTTDST